MIEPRLSRGLRPKTKTPIRRARLELDITQVEMAQRMGIARTTYNALENGHGPITLKLARKVAMVTGQTVWQVLDEYERLASRRSAAERRAS